MRNHSEVHGHTCPDPDALPGVVTPDVFDEMVLPHGDGILALADLYALGLANRTLLAHRLYVAWQSKRYGEWVEVGLTRCMFRETGFSVNGIPATPPAKPLTLFRAARQEHRGGVSWTTTPQNASGIGKYNSDGSLLWKVTVPTDRLLGFIDFEDEFLLDLEDLDPERVDPDRARPHKRTLRIVERWKRQAVRRDQRPRLYNSPWTPVEDANVH